MLHRLADLLRERAANFTTLTALSAPFAMVLAAVAIDTGSLFTERRELQALADLSAITAASAHSDRGRAVLITLTDNGVATPVLGGGTPRAGTVTVSVEGGRYAPDPTLGPDQRFAASAALPNAVRVTLRRIGTRHFATALIDPPVISAEAVAFRPAEAAFSIGSRLASVKDGLLNKVLGGLVGGNVSLNLMDYRALVDADIEMFSFAGALATRLHLTGASYRDVLQSDAAIGDVVHAMADIPGTDPIVRTALRVIAARSSTRLKVPVGKLIDLGRAASLAVGSRPAGLNAVAGVMDLLSASAALANGENQVRIDLAAGLPGLLDATLNLAIGEPPQGSAIFAVSEAGGLVRTAQTRLLLEAAIGGPGGLLGSRIAVPLYVELAFAEGRLTALNCPTVSKGLRATVDTRPGVAMLRIAEPSAAGLSDFRRPLPAHPAAMIKLPLIEVRAGATVAIANLNPTAVSFTAPEIAARAVKTVSTRDLTQSLVRSVLSTLHLDIKVAGLDLGVSALAQTTIANSLATATPALDDLLASVLTALGVRVGEVDVRMHGAACGRPVLVQ